MADQDTQSPPGKSSRFPWVVTALLGGFSAGMLGSPWLEANVRGLLPSSLHSSVGNTEADRAALKARVTALEEHPTTGVPVDISARLATLEASRQVGAAGAAAVASDLEPLSQRVDRIDTRLTSAEQAAHAATTAAALIPGLQAQVQTTTTVAAEQTKHTRMLASLGPLRRLIEGGQPLGIYYGIISDALGASTTDVAILRQVQAGGPTLAGLQQQYAALLPQLATASTDPTSWIDHTLAGLTNLVQVKRTADASQLATASALAIAASQRVRGGDVAGALVVLRRLPAVSQSRVAAWQASANIYVASRTAITRIENNIFELTAGLVPPRNP